MSKNHPNDNIYSILGKLQALQPTPQEKHDATVKSIYESVEAQGSILKGLREVSSTEQRLAEQFAAEGKDQGKPGKTFAKIAKSAGEHYGSAEAGKRVAGAVKAKLAKQGKLEEKWGTEMHTAEKDKGMFKGKTQAELKSQLAKLKASGPHEKGSDAYKKQNQIEFALRAKHKFGKVGEQNIGPGTGGMEEDIASFGMGAEHTLDEKAPPGMEKMVMKLKKEYPGHPEKAFATAWSIYNKKHGKAEESREACAECSGMEEAVHIGKYGTEYYGTKDFTGDDEDAPKAKSTEKKGRGRPTKASTGEKTSQERMPWGGKPPKTDANPTKKWPKASTTVHKISESMNLVGQRLVEGLNFKKMAEETHQSIDELMSELQRDISHYKATGNCSEKLKDFLQVHSHGKKQMADEAAMEASAKGIGHDLVTPAQRLAPTQSKPGVMGAVKDVAKGASNWLRGKPETGPTYEEVDPLEEELNELAKLAGLKVADEGNAFTGKLKSTPKGGKFDLDGKEYTDTSALDESPEADYKHVIEYAKHYMIAKQIDALASEDVDAIATELGLPMDEVTDYLYDVGLAPVDEGNAFSGKLAQAKAQHKDHFELGGKEIEVKEADAPVEEPTVDPVNRPKPEFKTMRQSTMNPGEGDAGEKKMFGGRGDNRMTQQPNVPAKPVRSVKEAFAQMEAHLAKEYESIKKVSK